MPTIPLSHVSDSSLLARRKQSQPFLQSLELPCLPPLSNVLPEDQPLVYPQCPVQTVVQAPEPTQPILPMNIFSDPTYDILTTSLPQLQYPDTRPRQPSISSTNSDKIYSFVALPGTTQKKRPRRRFDEVERLYFCSWPECTKAYGTLNHLNAHVSMQNHGPKRHPAEFKEMRKEWRRQKKEREAMRKSAEKEYAVYSEPFAVHYPQNFYPSF